MFNLKFVIKLVYDLHFENNLVCLIYYNTGVEKKINYITCWNCTKTSATGSATGLATALLHVIVVANFHHGLGHGVSYGKYCT